MNCALILPKVHLKNYNMLNAILNILHENINEWLSSSKFSESYCKIKRGIVVNKNDPPIIKC